MGTSLTAAASKKYLRKKTNKSLFRRVNDWLHLWLGLSSGLIVLIVRCYRLYLCILNARSVNLHALPVCNPQQQAYLLPSQLRSIAAKAFGNEADVAGNHILECNLWYCQQGCHCCFYAQEDGYSMIYNINPIPGRCWRKKALNDDFSKCWTDIFYLWLPPKIRRQFGNHCHPDLCNATDFRRCMWWPKKNGTRQTVIKFKVKWKAGFKRVVQSAMLGFMCIVTGILPLL